MSLGDLWSVIVMVKCYSEICLNIFMSVNDYYMFYVVIKGRATFTAFNFIDALSTNTTLTGWWCLYILIINGA